jgi:hypothetical protein
MQMNDDSFRINFDWDVYPDSIAAIGDTSANVSIYVDAESATSNINRDSKTVRDTVYLSLYPLALWMAQSWWRLLYENATPDKSSEKYSLWRLAHDLTSAGEGFVWPDMEFISDGQCMQIINYKTQYTQASIDYINPFNKFIPLSSFEREARHIVDIVCERLSDSSIHDTELHIAWEAVYNEYRDTGLKEYRILEARLGFDPDAADPSLMHAMLEKARRFGTDSLGEIIAGFSSNDALDPLGALSSLEHRIDNGIVGKFNLPKIAIPPANDFAKPWEIGYTMAKQLRAQCGIGDTAITDDVLSDMLGINKDSLFSLSNFSNMTVAAKWDKDRDAFSFQGGRPKGRRFIVSRIIADKLLARLHDKWFSVTDSKTMRQKMQRAFAGEFLCPIDSLRDFIGNKTITSDRLEEAADYFQVSSHVPIWQLHNNGFLPDTLFGLLPGDAVPLRRSVA